MILQVPPGHTHFQSLTARPLEVTFSKGKAIVFTTILFVGAMLNFLGLDWLICNVYPGLTNPLSVSLGGSHFKWQIISFGSTPLMKQTEGLIDSGLILFLKKPSPLCSHHHP